MSPTLDRDEIAVRLACALIARDGYDDEGAPRDAVTLADALLAALASKNAATGAPEALEPDVPEGSTIAQLAAEQRASMGLTASMGATQHFKHDATPAPEAKRPEWVRIVKSESPSRFKDGDVLRVVKWVDEVPAVDVDGYDVSGYVLYDSKWAPAPCPPPVAGRGEALPEDVRDFLLDVEYAAKWANQPQGPTVEYVKGRLKELAALAHDILSRPVRP